MPLDVSITGASGYLGRALTVALHARGHRVSALVRAGGAARVAPGIAAREVDAFDVAQLAAALSGCNAIVHLIGTPNPNPRKAQEFDRVDLGSARVCATAAKRAGVAHFIYVSVAQPAPVMQAYVAARQAAESGIRDTGLAATFLRPWYVLGPGHRWPLLLAPFYAAAGLIPRLREGTRRLGLVTLDQMVRCLVRAVEGAPPTGTQRVVDVADIRAP
jgi:uncharacterized protein YbjT (DUF2867 family)